MPTDRADKATDRTMMLFVSFVNDDLAQLLYPEDILDSKNSKGWKKRFSDLAKGKGGGKRGKPGDCSPSHDSLLLH